MNIKINNIYKDTIIFIAFGFFTTMVFIRFVPGILLGFLLSVSIEFIQLFTGRFRNYSIENLVICR